MKDEKEHIQDIKEMRLNHFTVMDCNGPQDFFAYFIKNLSLNDFIEFDCDIKIRIIEKFGKFMFSISEWYWYQLYDFFIVLKIEDNAFISFRYAPKILDVDYDSNIFMKN